MKYAMVLLLAGLFPAMVFAQAADTPKHVVVIREDGRFAGWPANNGGWSWGDEILFGFTFGYHKEKEGHTIDPERPSVLRFARSLDGGETWAIEKPSFRDENDKASEAVEPEGNIDFTHPDFAMAIRMEGSSSGFSSFYYSYDRGHAWKGPYRLPDFGRIGIFSRTDYIVNGKSDCMIFSTAAKDEGGEGWPFCARTTDGGKTWDFVGWIGEQPGQRGYAIMPSTVRLSDTSLLSAIRRRGLFDRETKWWLEMFLSPDNGESWYLLDEPRIDNDGNPASMIRLEDGRIALTYGYRRPPHGIRAMISADNGQTWGGELILRADGARWDLGYPRSFQRTDGKCVTVYYFNDASGVERHIVATIWDPNMHDE